MLTVLLGGARSGKSSAALRIGQTSQNSVCFIATSPRIDGDSDLEARIAAHQAERPAGWRTIEAELDLAGAIDSAGDDDVIIDCLTVWLGNLIHHGYTDDAIDAASSAAIDAAVARRPNTTVVTNEVGMGIVPADALSRRFRDLLGRANQRWVEASHRALLVVAGRTLPLVDPAVT